MQNAVDIQGVGKDYPSFSLNDINLQVPEGSVMGLVGPNGAGKSTTLRIIMGLVHADRGTVKVLGNAMPSQQVEAKWDIGFASEDMRLHPSETVDFHLRFLDSIFPKWDKAYANDLLKRFGLDPAKRIKSLSHGQRVKASILMMLARRPRLLVLDEPTTGLDPMARRQVLEEMSAVLADEDRSIIFSSHNTLDVEQISDQITFISNGSVLFSQDKEDLLDSWRRLRLQVPDNFAMPTLGNLKNVQRAGHLVVVTTDAFDEGMRDTLVSAGALVHAVERMTLEEIFLTSIPESLEASI